jgi:hypothetical protein
MIGLIGYCRKQTLEIIKKSLKILPASIKIIYVAMHCSGHNPNIKCTKNRDCE